MKTLAEIAIDAGLVTKAGVVKAGRLAEERKQTLIQVLVRELGVDEVALIGALRKQTRVPLLDPAQIQVDPDALRIVARDACSRLKVLPLSMHVDGPTKVLRVAMADPTDTSAIFELEHLAHAEIEVTALPLSAIEELVDKGYKQFSTAVVHRPKPFGDNLFVTTKNNRPAAIDGPASAGEGEVSVTAQIPLVSLMEATRPAPDLEQRFAALCQVLVQKGVISEAELAEALQKLLGKGES
ncbi:MAG: hypothetical protein ACM31C_32630 [Acidobacteriota bacterium]